MFFGPRPTCKWVVEREHPGRYHNSTAVWKECGLIYASSRAEAEKKAYEIVGFANARVKPLINGRRA